MSLGRARVLRAWLWGPFWDLVCCFLSLLLCLWTPPSAPVEGAALADAILQAAAPKPRPSCKGPVPINSGQKMRAADFPCESPASCQLDGAINVVFILAAWELKTI